jgi:hypothetical protein
MKPNQFDALFQAMLRISLQGIGSSTKTLSDFHTNGSEPTLQSRG